MSIESMFLLVTLLAPPIAEADPLASDYPATVAEVRELSDRMNLGEPVNADLMDALASLPRHAPQLAADPEMLELRTQAQLQLARSALSDGDHETAVWIVDEAIRSAMGAEIPIENFGPSIAKLYVERRKALTDGGKASIEITCPQPCRVFLNEREIGLSIDELPLGVYRLWVEGTEGPDVGRVLSDVMLLEIDGEVVTRIFAPTPPPALRDEPKPPEDRPKTRLMPRGIEAAMVAVGIGMMGAGALMMGIQPGKDELIAGGVLFGLGGGILIAGSVTLGVDEVRVGKQRGRQAMVAWTLRF
jgi:hypothetical protein